jgi:hypothetical protein
MPKLLRNELLTDPHLVFRNPERGLTLARDSPRFDVPLADQFLEEDHSVRLGRNEIQNVTERETKRQRDRPKHLDYKRHFSVSNFPATFVSSPKRSPAEREPLGGVLWPR